MPLSKDEPLYRKIVIAVMAFEIVAFLGAVVYFAGLNIMHVLQHRTHLNYHYDFGFFYWAFHVVWHHHASGLLYNQALEQQWMSSLGYPIYTANQYVYPPQFAVLFSWLALFPYAVASQLWAWMAVCGYGLSIYLLGRLSFQRLSLLPRAMLLMFLFANDGFYSDITIGNVTWLLLTLLCIAFYFRYEKGWGIPAGFWIGVAAAVKVTPVFLVAYYLIRRDWNMVIGIFTGILSTTLVTAVVVGWRTLWDFVFGFSRLVQSSMDNGPAPYNLSFKGVLLWIRNVAHLSWSPSFVNHLFMVFLVGVGGMVLWFILSHRTVDPRADMALAALCLILISPLIEGTHLLILVVTALMTFSIWWSEHGTQGQAVTPWNILWLFVFGVSLLLLSVIRELFEGPTNSFPWLVVGYFLLSIATFTLLATRKTRQ